MNSHDLEKLILQGGWGADTSAGISVSPETAMRLITVQNCVRVRAFTIAQLPCHLMERIGDKKQKAENFYLYEKLLYQPNSWMTSFEFWGMAEAHMSVHGNFVAYKAMYGDEIRELLPIPSTMLQNITQNVDYSIDYEILFPNGDIKHLNGSQVLHLKGLTLNGFSGVNPTHYARETMGIGLASEKFLGRYFGKGMHPGAVIEHPLALNDISYKNLREDLKKKYEGLGRSHEFMLIDEGMKIQFPQTKLIDVQFLEQMKLNEAQICGLYRVPLMLIQSGDKTPTYASAEQFMLNYSVIGVTPDCVNYEMAIRRDLLMSAQRKRYYAKFNVDALLRGDFKTRMEGYQIGVNTEILNPNECRGYMDLNPYDGGNEYRTRTSTMKEQTPDAPKKDVKK